MTSCPLPHGSVAVLACVPCTPCAGLCVAQVKGDVFGRFRCTPAGGRAGGRMWAALVVYAGLVAVASAQGNVSNDTDTTQVSLNQWTSSTGALLMSVRATGLHV